MAFPTWTRYPRVWEKGSDRVVRRYVRAEPAKYGHTKRLAGDRWTRRTRSGGSAELDETLPTGTSSMWARRLWEHVGLVSSFVLLVMASLRLMAVSKFDTLTAMALVSYAPTSVVLLGVVMQIMTALPIVAPVTLTLYLGYYWPKLSTALRYRLALGAVSALVLGAMIVPWAGLAIDALLTIVYFGMGWLYRSQIQVTIMRAFGANVRPSTHRILRLFDRLIVTATLVILITIFPAMTILGQRTWLPSERLSFESQAALTGYVLDVADEEIVVLMESDRSIHRFPSGSLKKREVCQLAGDGLSGDRRTLMALMLRDGGPPSYIKCP